MQLRWRDLLLVPNILSLVRIAFLAVPVYLISLQDPGLRVWTLAAVCAGIVSDILDGYLARKLGQVSDLGKILDPAADKICTAALVISLYVYSDFPLWALVIIVVRDITVAGVSLGMLRKTTTLTTSNFAGRLAALSWGLVIVVYIMNWEILELPALVFATAMVAVSAYSYLRMILELLRSNRLQRT